ncbi:putative galactose oxidase/kelch, beta-propeller [Helianthus annuus]|nr:putative galactose oxidase/kelch, beta-propeller [Helianthus annuus]
MRLAPQALFKTQGTSHGLVCLFGCYLNPGHSRKPTAVIWNPSIRKSVAITLPNLDMRVAHALGFRVCPVTSDPKIVKISGTRSRHMKMKGVTCSSRWQVEVFSLRSGVWRNSYGNLSNNLVNLERPHSQVTIDGSIYWFGVGNTVGSDTQVWRMGNGDSKSFTKLFTIKKPYRYRWYMSSLPLGFRMTGELMMRKANNGEDSETLIDYDLFSHHVNDLGIESECSSLLVCSYKESLILLDQPDI